MGTFERVLWRVLRGNLYMNFAPIEEPFEQASGKAAEENKVHKNVFIIFARKSRLPLLLPVQVGSRRFGTIRRTRAA